MNRKHLSAGLPAVVSAAALVLLLISCTNESRVKGQTESRISPLSPLCKSIPAADLQNQFKRTGSNRTVVSIYPIKKSADMKRKDFDLVIVLHEGKNAPDVKKFEKEAKFYIQYMKKHQAQVKEIPTLYYATVHRKDARTVQGLQVCIDLTTTVASYDFTGSVSTGVPSFRLDSAGKCPPECPLPPETPE